MLVTTDELATLLGVTFTPEQEARATQIITTAGGRVQRYCNLVGLERIENHTITMPGSYGPELTLPRPPIVSVSEVLVDGQAVDGWTVVADTLVRTGQADADYPLARPFRHLGHWGGTSVEVQVTYTHGLAEVPPDAKAVCLDLCARVWSNPAGARSFSIDGYSAAWGVGATSGLTDDDRDTLKAWHRSSRTAVLS